jgi:hypothetical protein
MSTEEKKYLVNIESNLDKYAKEADEARKKVEELTIENYKLKNSDKATSEELERSNAALRVAQKEYRSAKTNLDNVTEANKSQSLSYNQLYKQWTLAQKELKNMANAYVINEKGVRVLSQEYIKQSKVVADAKKGLDAFGKGINDNRLNVGNYTSALQGLPGPMGMVISSVQRLAGALKTLLINPIVLAIAALVAALASLYKSFKETDAGATYFKAKMEQLHAAWSVYLQTVRLAGGDERAVKHLRDATKAAKEYIYRLDLINDRMTNNLNKYEQEEAAIEKYLLLSKDMTLPIAERIKYLEKAQEKEKEIKEMRIKDAEDLYNEEIKYAAEKYNIDVKLLDRFVQADDRTAQMMMENDKNVKRVRNNMNDEYSKKLEELYSKKAQLERESDSSQKRLVSQLSSLYKQEIKEAEDKEKAKAEDEKRMKQASVKLEIELEKIKNAELLKEREKFAADMISQLTEEIDSQFETFAKEDEYEKNRQLINSQNRLAIQESEVQNQWDLKQMQLDNDREMELSAAEKTGASVLLINEKYANYQKILDSEVADAKLKIYSDFAGSIASLFGEQTAIGRIAAVTQTAINTYVAAMSVYKDTPGGIIIRSLAAATAVLTGLSTIKKILEVKSGLPGDSGASMQNVIISNPITQRNFASTIPSSAITQAQLTQGQLNAIPNQQNLLTAQDIANAIKNLPNPVVTVEDINAKVKSVNKVTVRGTI